VFSVQCSVSSVEGLVFKAVAFNIQLSILVRPNFSILVLVHTTIFSSMIGLLDGTVKTYPAHA
jgi:hypothetical protein